MGPAAWAPRPRQPDEVGGRPPGPAFGAGTTTAFPGPADPAAAATTALPRRGTPPTGAEATTAVPAPVRAPVDPPGGVQRPDRQLGSAPDPHGVGPPDPPGEDDVEGPGSPAAAIAPDATTRAVRVPADLHGAVPGAPPDTDDPDAAPDADVTRVVPARRPPSPERETHAAAVSRIDQSLIRMTAAHAGFDLADDEDDEPPAGTDDPPPAAPRPRRAGRVAVGC
jgi:hypothetical protein